MTRSAHRSIWFVALAALVLLTGCSSTVPGAGVPGEIDVRTLDTGRFPTTTPTLSAALVQPDYLGIEAARMADAVLSPFEVDPKYALGATASAHTRPDSVVRYLFDSTVPVLRKHGMVLGFSTASADTQVPPEKALHDTAGQRREGLTVTVTRFPDEGSATAAAVELDAVDSVADPNNVPVRLPKYPRAAAHWRPTFPTLGSTTPHGPFVISVYAVTRNTDLNLLIGMTEKYLEAEIAMLDTFEPTPITELRRLRQDPDGMLARSLHDGGVVGRPDGNSEVVYTTRGYLNFVLDQVGRSRALRDAGVDRVAVAPMTFLFRTRDVDAAKRWVRESAELGDPAERRVVDPPEDVPGASCVEDLFTIAPQRFRCFVAYGRYGALLLGTRLWETKQRAAAQFALLANSGGR
ncbi:DUF7373 family lipoprotein [Nocardia sp. bgisy134]|uniref:DUF7373 family lipoprotein n=1 Tax=Nocardia sp. bgisy134 TaxID=3413789 RepID=UPI003D740A2C